jgi:hypothetical protein
VSSGAICWNRFFVRCGCVCLSAWLPLGKGLRLVHKRPQGEVAAAGTRQGTAPALALSQSNRFVNKPLHSLDFLGSFWTFPLLSSEGDFYTPTGNLLSACAKSLRLHYDLFGSLKRNEHPQSTDRGFFAPRGGSEGAPFQSFQAAKVIL